MIQTNFQLDLCAKRRIKLDASQDDNFRTSPGVIDLTPRQITVYFRA